MEEIFLHTIKEYENVLRKFKDSSYKAISQTIECILECWENDGKVLLIGNGGSAADCQHLAGEFMGRFRLNRIPLAAIALTTDSSVITCIANDFDFEVIFSRQIKAIAKTGDVLWAFSTSGSSSNIIKGVHKAKEKGVKTISFTGKPNSELESISDICLCSNTEHTNHAQEFHQLAYHIICRYIDTVYSKTTFPN